MPHTRVKCRVQVETSGGAPMNVEHQIHLNGRKVLDTKRSQRQSSAARQPSQPATSTDLQQSLPVATVKPRPYGAPIDNSSQSSPAFTNRNETTTTSKVIHRHEERTVVEQKYSGWTVSNIVPNAPGEKAPMTKRESRIVEVTEAGIRRAQQQHQQLQQQTSDGVQQVISHKSHTTLEEELDNLFHQQDYFPESPDPTVPMVYQFRENLEPPRTGIFANNAQVMHQCEQRPDQAEFLLQNQWVYVRCASCNRCEELSSARAHYVYCLHCYTYYCQRSCRIRDWPRHKPVCNYARINTLCKRIIMKARMDSTAAYHMSCVARDGYARKGRGAVNLRFPSVHQANVYLKGGWTALDRGTFLYFYSIADLLDNQKDAAMIELCHRYDPTAKLILFVSIIADVEECPESPAPTRPTSATDLQRYGSLYERNKMATPAQMHQLEMRRNRSGGTLAESVDTSSATLKSMLRNVEAQPRYQSSTPLIV